MPKYSLPFRQKLFILSCLSPAKKVCQHRPGHSLKKIALCNSLESRIGTIYLVRNTTLSAALFTILHNQGSIFRIRIGTRACSMLSMKVAIKHNIVS